MIRLESLRSAPFFTSLLFSVSCRCSHRVSIPYMLSSLDTERMSSPSCDIARWSRSSIAKYQLASAKWRRKGELTESRDLQSFLLSISSLVMLLGRALVPRSLPRCPPIRFYSSRIMSGSQSASASSIVSVNEANSSDTKFVGLQSIVWKDPTGRERKWETSHRKTKKGEADA